MPIVFEQPDPQGYSPLAGAAGTVHQGNLDRQYLQSQLALGLQAGHAQAQIAAQQQHASSAQAAAAQHAAMQSQALAQQGQVSDRDVFLAQQHQQAMQQQTSMQQQAFAARAQERMAEFSFQDNMRLSQLKNALSTVDNDPTLSDIEKQQYRTKLQTGIDPLVERQKAAQAQLMEQQAKTNSQMEATRAAGVKTYHEFIAGNPNGYRVLEDGTIMAMKMDGAPVFHKPSPEQPDPVLAQWKGQSEGGRGRAATAAVGFDVGKSYERWSKPYKNEQGESVQRSLEETEKLVRGEKTLHEKFQHEDQLRRDGDLVQTLEAQYPDLNQMSPALKAAYQVAKTRLKPPEEQPPESAPVPAGGEGASEYGAGPYGRMTAGLAAQKRQREAEAERAGHIDRANERIAEMASQGKQGAFVEDGVQYYRRKDGSVFINTGKHIEHTQNIEGELFVRGLPGRFMSGLERLPGAAQSLWERLK